MNPLKHAQLFQRNLSSNGDPVYAYVGLLETNDDITLEEDNLHILSHAQKKLIDTEGSLRDAFTIAPVDKKTEWGHHITQTMLNAKQDRCSPHPTVSEYLHMPCWPRFSDPEVSSLLHTSGFRVFATEKADTYVIFGIATHSLIEDAPDEAWLALSPQGAKRLSEPLFETNGSTLDQVLAKPVWTRSDGSTYALSYNSQPAHQVYDQLNQLAMQWYKGDIPTNVYNEAVLSLQESSSLFVKVSRTIKGDPSDLCYNQPFIQYVAIKMLLETDSGDRMLISKNAYDHREKLIQRAYELAVSVDDIHDFLFHLSRQELEQVALNQAPDAIKQSITGSLIQTPDEDLMAMVTANLFFTNDGYLLMKYTIEDQTVWTNFDVSFPDQDGLPFHDLDGEYLQGQFVLPNHQEAVSRQYQTILDSKRDYELSNDALTLSQQRTQNNPLPKN